MQEATAYFTGAVGQQRIPEYFLSDYIIPLPPIEAQRCIASKLQELMQEIYNLKSAVSNQLEAAKALPAAYLREVFESEEAKKWERKRLEEVCEKPQYGYTQSAVLQPVGPKFLRITDIQNGKVIWENVPYCEISESDKSTFKLLHGDIVIARSGATTGKSFLISNPPDSVFASYLIRVRVLGEWLLPEFLYIFLQSEQYWEQVNVRVRGGAQPNMNAKLIQSIVILIPSTSIQQRIASDLKEKMAQVEKLQSTISNLQYTIEVLPQAILRKAFRGEL